MIVLTEGFGASTAIADFIGHGLLSSQRNCSISTGGPLGDPYIVQPGDNGFGLRGLATSLPTFTVGVRVYLNPTCLIKFNSPGGNTQFSIGIGSSAVTAYRGEKGTTLGSAAVSLPTTTWLYVEIAATLSATVGTITVRVSGVSVLTLTGVNNEADTANPTFSVLYFGSVGIIVDASNYAHIYITDTTAPNAGFLGDVRVFSRFPTANSAVAFTPVGLANNYQNAAVVPPVPATDYNTDATAAAQDTFSGPSLPTGLGNIFAVGIKSLVQDTLAGTRTVENVLISGATTATGAAFQPPVTPSAAYAIDIFNTDPNTSAAWTEANAQATTFGYKIAS